MGNKLTVGDSEVYENGFGSPDPNKSLDQYWNEVDGVLPRQVTAVVIGAGLRGVNYANFALDFPSRLKIVGVAEPRSNRREKLQQEHQITSGFTVDDWKKLVELDKFADLAIIATPGELYKDVAISFAKKGYHLFLEDPVSVKQSDSEAIAEACENYKIMAGVCHVLRYFPPCVKIREIIESGALGKIVTVNHQNNVLYWHFAHSFVRGKWNKTASTTFSLMATCSQDIDLITYWMGDSKCTSIQSFGDLYHFKSSQKPDSAAPRCFECPVETDCPYSAQKIYMSAPNDAPRWPMSAVCDVEDSPKGYKAALEDELRTGPYGRCVYACDNDVCDHQMVNMVFESGATANLTMNAFTKNLCRETKICGTHGELRWDGSAHHPIHLFDFATEETKRILPDQVAPACKTRGHAGADFFIMNSMLKAIANNNPSLLPSNIKESLHSYKLVCLAEKSRNDGSVLKVVN